jgi:hypothetical protein
MRCERMWAVILIAAVGTFLSRPAVAITVGQVDDFEDGTVMGWVEGPSSPNPTTHVLTGGPAGDGDAYLENISSGGFGAGGRQVMFNSAQWDGDYLSEGVALITADMANFGQSPLAMRIAFGQGPAARSATWYVSEQAIDLPADGQWHSVEFGLSGAGLSCVNGACGSTSLADVLSDVTAVRIVAATSPDFQGDQIAATLGVDNISAVGLMLLGDVNLDAVVNGLDVDPFVDVLLNGPFQAEADMNEDAVVNGLDVDPFVVAVVGGGVQAVPEPSSVSLLAILASSLMVPWKRVRRTIGRSRGAG